MPLATDPLAYRQQRWDDMQAMKNAGKTLEEMAAKYNIRRQRAWSILTRPRPNRQYGGRPRKRVAA